MAIRFAGEDYGKQLQYEITREADRIFKERYGNRHPATLSTQEWDNIITKASKIVMARRKGHGKTA